MIDEFNEKAAQLWCLPQHGSKVMDVDFAMSIAQALREAHAAGKIEAYEDARELSRLSAVAARMNADSFCEKSHLNLEKELHRKVTALRGKIGKEKA